MRMLKFGISASLLLSLLLVALPVAAQFSSEESPVSVILTPNYPRPYQTVLVSPRSSLIDLTSSTVVISANGVVVQRGSGTQGASVTMGGPGEETKVVVSVTAPNGKVSTVTVPIRPADAALVVEPDTTVHPFYKGLPLSAPEGLVRLVAIPDLRSSPTKPIDPKTLVYTWKLGDRTLLDASGIGRSVLVATAPPRYRDADVTLLITSQDSSVVAEAKTTISPRDPIVRIYPFDPLLGADYDHALTASYTLTSTEATLRAVPYFFASPPAIEWSVGGTLQGAQRDLTVRSSGNGKGNASLEVRTKLQGTTQLASSRLTLRFGEGKSPLSIFGF